VEGMTIASEQIVLSDIGSYLHQRCVGTLNASGLPLQELDDLIPIQDCDMEWFNALNGETKNVVWWYINELGMTSELTKEQLSIWKQ